MSSEALGMLEVKGYAGAVEAADAMAKAASVKVLGSAQVGSGFVAILIQGQVGAVTSAVAAGSQAAQKVGQVISSHIIARPHASLELVLREVQTGKGTGTDVRKAITSLHNSTPLAHLTVAELRNLARETEGINLKGRDISMANKEELIQALKKLYPER